MHIIVQENGLVHHRNVVPDDALQHGPVGDLAVDQGVAQRVLPVPEHPLIISGHVPDGLVPDDMGHHLQAVLVGDAAEGVHIPVGGGLHAEIAGIVQISLAHSAGAAAERAVLEQLHRAEGQHIRVGAQAAGIAAGIDELLQVLRRIKADLEAVAQGAAVFLIERADHIDDRVPGIAGVARVIGLNRGDTVGQGVLRAGEEIPPGVLQVGLGQHAVGQSGGRFGKDTVGHAVFVHLNGAALYPAGLLGHAQQLQRPGIGGGHMAAHPAENDGNIGGDAVQVIAVGHPLLIPEQVLVPAGGGKAPGAGLGMGGHKGLHPLYHIVDGG